MNKFFAIVALAGLFAIANTTSPEWWMFPLLYLNAGVFVHYVFEEIKSVTK